MKQPETVSLAAEKDLINTEYNLASELWYNSELVLKQCVEQGDETGALHALEELKIAVNRRFTPILSKREIVGTFFGILGGILHFACRDAGLPPAYLTMIILDQKDRLYPMIEIAGEIHLFDSRINQAMAACISQACRLVNSFSLAGYSPLVRRCISLIHHRLTDEFTVSELAAALDVTRQHLAACFKNETGSSLTEYINHQRVRLSKYYLRQKNLSITQVAMMCGYSDSNYFGRVFKKREHMTPREYAAQNFEINY